MLRSLLPVLALNRREEIEQEFREAVGALRELAARYAEKPEAENPAKQLARAWRERVPLIYGGEVTEAVARRWKTQINENAKQPAFWDVLPELHHNEIMGWESPLTGGFVYALLRDPDEHPQVQKRLAITRELLEERGHTVLEFQGQGHGLLARLLTLSYLGDWASFYLAILSGVDPTPVGLIEAMKRKLA
jgi:glucose/mannose-6-phosphate isomerase